MIDNACQALASHLEDKLAGGLVDVKFYLRNLEEASADEVCREVLAIHDAMDRKAFVPLDFRDSRRVSA